MAKANADDIKLSRVYSSFLSSSVHKKDKFGCHSISFKTHSKVMIGKEQGERKQVRCISHLPLLLFSSVNDFFLNFWRVRLPITKTLHILYFQFLRTSSVHQRCTVTPRPFITGPAFSFSFFFFFFIFSPLLELSEWSVWKTTDMQIICFS